MLAKLKKLFPEFTFTQSEILGKPCYHGVINVNHFTERVGKARITYGNVIIFISSEMYKGTDKSFFYGTIFQQVNVIPFRKQKASLIEANKFFSSNKDCEKLIDELFEGTDMSKYKLKPLA